MTISRGLLIATLLLAMALACAAQENRGAITGTITDATSASVPNVEVTATNVATNVSRELSLRLSF